MGYATVKRVPRVFDPRHAKQVHDNALPIRGRSPEVRPLGNRKDVDTYSVRMNGSDVEFVLYKTPVITYKPDGEIVLRTAGWASVSSHQFIQQVLGIPARGKGGSSVLIVNGQHYTMTGNNPLVIRRGEGTGTWEVIQHETLYGYKANRKAITNVRSRYSEFRKYLGGFVNLRRDEHVLHQGKPYELRANVIKFDVQEAVDMFGVVDSAYNDAKALDRSKINCIFTKPTEVQHYHTEILKQAHRARVREYEENMKAFTDTIVNGQPEDVKHQNFYRGAVALLVEGFRYHRANAKAEWVLHSYEQSGIVNVNEWMLAIDEAILKYHAEEVLEHVALEVGKTPNPKYAKWVSEKV